MTIKASEPIISIEIMDELGRILFKEKINAIHFQLLTSFLKSGNYFVMIESENYELMEKLVINR
jgi:hypothetical protein